MRGSLAGNLSDAAGSFRRLKALALPICYVDLPTYSLLGLVHCGFERIKVGCWGKCNLISYLDLYQAL